MGLRSAGRSAVSAAGGGLQPRGEGRGRLLVRSVKADKYLGHGLVPVVSRIASGNGQLVIDGENGFLIGIGDIATFAQRLKLLADEGSLLARMKRAAWKTSRQYTVELMVDRYLECFDYIKTTGLSREYRIQAAGSYPIMASCTSHYPVWLRKVKRHLQVSRDTFYSFVGAMSDVRHD